MTLPAIGLLEFDDTQIADAAPQTVHRTLDWDFDAGDFRLKDGKTVELTGIEYLKVWIRKALRTVRDALIYEGTGYGSEHFSLIGRNFKPDFVNAEMERMIREALMENEAITGVIGFSFASVGSRLEITFTVESIFGSTQQAVIA